MWRPSVLSGTAIVQLFLDRVTAQGQGKLGVDL